MRGLATTLADAEIGLRVRVTLLSGVDQADLVCLAGVGILPGVDVMVLRRTPTLCVDVDGACFAIDGRLARGVVVERWEPPA